MTLLNGGKRKEGGEREREKEGGGRIANWATTRTVCFRLLWMAPLSLSLSRCSPECCRVTYMIELVRIELRANESVLVGLGWVCWCWAVGWDGMARRSVSSLVGLIESLTDKDCCGCASATCFFSHSHSLSLLLD
ncbi:hypothetical protein T439DRAFT_52928 [Meredithblackwellia eburnea MCA 4105]